MQLKLLPLKTKNQYTAESRALATLEVSVHLDLSEDLPEDRLYVVINIPDEIIIQEVKLEDLPAEWNSKPPKLTTQTIGDDFVNYNEAGILKVPSSIIPKEYNYLINPSHPDSSKIKVLSFSKMKFDARLKTVKKKASSQKEGYVYKMILIEEEQNQII